MTIREPAIFVKFPGSSGQGCAELSLQSKRKMLASSIPYHKEGSTVPGRPLWDLETTHSTARNTARAHIYGDTEGHQLCGGPRIGKGYTMNSGHGVSSVAI